MWERYGETRGKDMGKAIPVFYWKTVGWGFLQLGCPSSHPFLDGIFHEINYPASLGYPIDGNPHRKAILLENICGTNICGRKYGKPVV